MQNAKLQIGFDPGASLSKIVYAINEGSPRTLTMEPSVLSLPAKSVSDLNLTARPEDQAWVKLDRNSDRVQVCGFLAREFLAVERIELLKYEQAFYKFLAAVGVIVVKESLERVSIEAAVLLPYGEINSRDWLKQELVKSLKRYYFQNTLIRAQLESCQCVSEGSGMIRYVHSKRGSDWIKSHRVVVLILGYRNLSCLTFERGVLQKKHSATSDLGFVKLIDKIIDRTPGQTRSGLIAPVCEIGADVRIDHPELRYLIRSSQPENVEAEAKMLAEAIRMARYEYWQIVQDWLNSVVPTDLQELAISGGTGIYLKGELDRYFDWADPEWLGSKSGELSQAEPSLQFRFADVMALFESTFQFGEAA